MSKKLGFIGCGNMGKAMIHGVLASGKAQASDILASAKTESSREKNAAELGIRLTADNKSVAEFADILFLAVKPQYYEEVIAEIKDAVSDDEIIVSIAPGKSLSWFDEMFGKSLKVIRTMPNTPAMVGEGMMGVCANERVSQAELDTVLDLCSGFSKAEMIDEKLMDVVTAVSGSSPAYVFMFIEAMADAAVAGGMPRSQAYTRKESSAASDVYKRQEPGIYICSPGSAWKRKNGSRDRKASGRAQGYGVLTCRNHYPGCACA